MDSPVRRYRKLVTYIMYAFHSYNRYSLTRFPAWKPYSIVFPPPKLKMSWCLSVEIKGATENRTGLPNYIVTCQQCLDNGPGNPLTTRHYSEIPGNQKLPAHNRYSFREGARRRTSPWCYPFIVRFPLKGGNNKRKGKKTCLPHLVQKWNKGN